LSMLTSYLYPLIDSEVVGLIRESRAPSEGLVKIN